MANESFEVMVLSHFASENTEALSLHIVRGIELASDGLMRTSGLPALSYHSPFAGTEDVSCFFFFFFKEKVL